MSRYTTEVRFICEHYAGVEESSGFDDIDEIIDEAAPFIFKEYPIFDEEYRAVLNRKILSHYYTMEICAETVGLWKHWLNNKMNEIMPYYNQLYKSALLEFDPFGDVDLTTSKIRNENTDSETNSSEVNREKVSQDYTEDSSSTASSTDKNHTADTTSTNTHTVGADATADKDVEKFSDTPQGGLQGVEAGNYLTNATISDKNTVVNTDEETNSSSSSSSDISASSLANNTSDRAGNSSTDRENSMVGGTDKTVKTTEDYIEKITGKRNSMSYSTLLEKYRKTFLNIDVLIINELDGLFLKLW